MNSSLEIALNLILKFWKQTYFFRPALFVISLYSIHQIKKSDNQSGFSRLCCAYLVMVCALFSYVELTIILRRTIFPNIPFEQVRKLNECTSLIFQILEFYIFILILNFSLEEKMLYKLKSIGLAVLLILLPVQIASILKSDSFQSLLFNGELFSFISNAMLLPGFVFYFIQCYKRSIHRTSTLPTIVSLLGYLIVGVLIYPCGSFFLVDYPDIAWLLYCYHYLLLAIVILTMKYNATKVTIGPNELIKYDIN